VILSVARVIGGSSSFSLEVLLQSGGGLATPNHATRLGGPPPAAVRPSLAKPADVDLEAVRRAGRDTGAGLVGGVHPSTHVNDAVNDIQRMASALKPATD